METSVPGNSVHLEMDVWYDEEQGHVHLTAKNLHDFHTTVNRDPTSTRGHPDLFAKLTKALKEAGAPHAKNV